MQRKRILFLGFGDLAKRMCPHLSGCELVGVARSPKEVSAGVTFIQGAADSLPTCEQLRDNAWDVVVITLTPTEFSDRAYELGYVHTLARLLEFAKSNPPGLILFTSSTGVYQQADGEWVDESTPVNPESFSGKRLLEAENLLVESGLAHCILRVAGIYGPGRTVVMRQVQQGKGGSNAFTNRIHSEDCAGFMAHLIQQYFQGEALESLYVVCDGQPETGRNVRLWLARQMGLEDKQLSGSVSERGGNKRCSNKRMLATGFALRYSDFRHGYSELLEESCSVK